MKCNIYCIWTTLVFVVLHNKWAVQKAREGDWLSEGYQFHLWTSRINMGEERASSYGGLQARL